MIILPAQNAVSPAETQKLRTALTLLPERTRQGIANGDTGEFLEDFKAVLAGDRDDLLRLVDKTHALPDGYQPPDTVPLVKNNFYAISRDNLALRKPAEQALRLMGAAAQKDGITLLASSTYRSYDYQVTVYNRNVRLSGKETADRESAQPGKSQHQLGTVVDFGSISDAFADTGAGKWLAAHAGEYGWSLSFPDGYEDVTGYRWECWHYRYIGVTAAAFQKKWFSNIQQFMLEFINAWRAST
ncbi:MAG: M15 family metallopeptidase [Treponema sp.]|nr:M15 family metallopeptidase [Treponema sp.]